MTPVTRCLRNLDHASVISDSSTVALVADALDELEASFYHSSERVVALEAVFQHISRQRPLAFQPYGRFLLVQVERRQERLATNAA